MYLMNLRDKVMIPRHWTSHDAHTVLRFLYEIADAIWEVHGDGIIGLCNDASPQAPFERSYQPPTSLDDDLPF